MFPLVVFFILAASLAATTTAGSRPQRHSLELFWSPRFLEASTDELSPAHIVSAMALNVSTLSTGIVPQHGLPAVKVTAFDHRHLDTAAPSLSSVDASSGLLMQFLHKVLADVAGHACGLSAANADDGGKPLIASRAGIRVVDDRSGDVVAMLGYEVDEDGASDGGSTRRSSWCLPRSASAPPTVGGEKSVGNVAVASASEIMDVLREKENQGFKANSLVPINMTHIFVMNGLLDLAQTAETPDPASAAATIDLSSMPGPEELDLFSLCNITGIAHDAMVEADSELQVAKRWDWGDPVTGEDMVWDSPVGDDGATAAPGERDSADWSGLFDTPKVGDDKDADAPFSSLDGKHRGSGKAADAVLDVTKDVAKSSLKGLITSAPKVALAAAGGGVTGVLGELGKAAAKKVAKEVAKHIAKKTGKKILGKLTHADERAEELEIQRAVDARLEVEKAAEAAARRAVNKAKDEMWAAQASKDAELDRMRKTIEELKGPPKSILKGSKAEGKKVKWDAEVEGGNADSETDEEADARMSQSVPALAERPKYRGAYPGHGIVIDEPGESSGQGPSSKGKEKQGTEKAAVPKVKPPPPAPGIEIKDDEGEPAAPVDKNGKGKQKVAFAEDGALSPPPPPSAPGGSNGDGGNDPQDNRFGHRPGQKLAYCEWVGEPGNQWAQWIPVTEEWEDIPLDGASDKRLRRSVPVILGPRSSSPEPCAAAALESALFQARQLSAVLAQIQQEGDVEEGDEALFAPQQVILDRIQGNITSLQSSLGEGLLCGSQGEAESAPAPAPAPAPAASLFTDLTDVFDGSDRYFGLSIRGLRVVEAGECKDAPVLDAGWLGCGTAVAAAA
ncbi:uncharacterized protein E0L32_007943 [Thyridium curvatum]|uniref:Uncharacterized protein n=1 Tax=Thyridium curvatum TaxID=1093900 RepID=A0A507AMK4_9PEZI|nr:uncharacterized protein E0L32_007943 [Thyridium curvatum]TPX11082.1 hypothetical protein E0L32_007943 [Thyridium curvatum]